MGKTKDKTKDSSEAKNKTKNEKYDLKELLKGSNIPIFVDDDNGLHADLSTPEEDEEWAKKWKKLGLKVPSK